MAENKQLDELEQDPGLAPGHAAIKDLEPEHDEAASVERGIFHRRRRRHPWPRGDHAVLGRDRAG